MSINKSTVHVSSKKLETNSSSSFLPPPPFPHALQMHLDSTINVTSEKTSENSILTNEQCYYPVKTMPDRKLVYDYSCYEVPKDYGNYVHSKFFLPDVKHTSMSSQQNLPFENTSFVNYNPNISNFQLPVEQKNALNSHYTNYSSYYFSSTYFPTPHRFQEENSIQAVESVNNKEIPIDSGSQKIYASTPVYYSHTSVGAKSPSNSNKLLNDKSSTSQNILLESQTDKKECNSLKKSPQFSLDSVKPILKSRENKLVSELSCLQELLGSKSRNLQETPKAKSKEFPRIVSKKRKFAESEEESKSFSYLENTEVNQKRLSFEFNENKYGQQQKSSPSIESPSLSEESHLTPKVRSLNEFNRRKSFPFSIGEKYGQQQKSLPNIESPSISEKGYLTPKVGFLNEFNRRKSFPFSKFSPLSTSVVGRCVTDQTPYNENVQQRKRIKSLLPYYNAFDLVDLESDIGFIDSHCHLDFLFQRQGYMGTLLNYQDENKDTFPKSYKGCVAVFCNPFTFRKEYLWKKYLHDDNVWASFGCHPHNAKDYNDGIEKDLCLALKHPKVQALGEIGLDYSNRNNCVKDVQFEVFRRQLNIALQKKLSVVIHCREAHEDAIRIIKEILPTDYIIHLHCFTDTWEKAEEWLETFPNLFIGITNVVTFPSAESVHEVARNIPLNRLLLETDAPYFLPRMGVKGNKWSHPGMAIHVAAQIAALKNVSIEEVFVSTRKNTKRVYSI